MSKFSAIFLILITLNASESARILAIVPTPSYSHQKVYKPLWANLSARGHQLTLLTTYPSNSQNLTNLTEIDLSFANSLWNTQIGEIVELYTSNILLCFYKYIFMINDIVRQELEHADVQNLIRDPNEHFNLVISELLHPAMLAFGERFKCPIIGVSPMDIPTYIHNSIGNPTSPGLFVDIVMPFDNHMSFLQRVCNTIYYVIGDWYFKYWYRLADGQVEKYFGKNYPGLESIQENISMVFLNTNPILHNIRPLLPNVIQIGGGFHLDKEQKLPEDIKLFLDQAKDGAIYFSLGTNINSKILSEHTKTVLVEVFSEMKYKVLWKFDNETIVRHPNILIKKWLPQQAILAHPNVKLFITQGGLQSLEEAVYNSVPMIGMPTFVDQFANVRRMVRKGLGIELEYNRLEKRVLKDSIEEVISNKRYKQNAEKLSILLKEQPVSGLTEAVFWTEYVIQFKGARLLKRHPQHLPAYQYYLLDVIGTVLLVLSLSIYLVYKLSVLALKSFKKIKFKLD